MRSEEWPSQSGGMRPAFPFPARTSCAAATILAGSVPMSKFVPSEIVMGALCVLTEGKARHPERGSLLLDTSGTVKAAEASFDVSDADAEFSLRSAGQCERGWARFSGWRCISRVSGAILGRFGWPQQY